MTRICLFSPIPYASVLQRPQRLAERFVALGFPVTFIEPCGLSEQLHNRWTGLPCLLLSSIFYHALGLAALVVPRIGNRRVRRRGIPAPRAAIAVARMPLLFPSRRVDSPVLEKINAAVLRQALKRNVIGALAPDESAIAIVQQPFWGIVIRKGDFSAVAYDCIDEMILFSGRSSRRRYEQFEGRLLDMASAAFTTAEALEENLRQKGCPIPLIRVPNGVAYDWFQRRAGEGGPPDDIKAIRPPIAGYVGVLRAWFDYDLLGHLAAAMPDVSFVIIGPLDIREKIARVTGKNLFWFGRRPSGEIPRYVGRFDVCLIPFAGEEITATTNPVKLFEYFALGKPVVTTPLRELEPYRKEGLVRAANGAGEFESAIRASLAETDPSLAARRREIAKRHDWSALAGTMIENLIPAGVR